MVFTSTVRRLINDTKDLTLIFGWYLKKVRLLANVTSLQSSFHK